jgi:hypothetical protein
MQSTRRRRVIINTDAKNEADDQYAIVHALLSPSLDVRGLVAAHLGDSRSTTSMADSVDVRFLIEDMFAKLRKFGRNTDSQPITSRLEARP